MIKTQLNSDKLAMGLSMACVIHCFFAPAVVILAYGVSAFTIESELIHYLLLMLAAPISLFALLSNLLESFVYVKCLILFSFIKIEF